MLRAAVNMHAAPFGLLRLHLVIGRGRVVRSGAVGLWCGVLGFAGKIVGHLPANHNVGKIGEPLHVRLWSWDAYRRAFGAQVMRQRQSFASTKHQANRSAVPTRDIGAFKVIKYSSVLCIWPGRPY